jgi:hypothetical protein
MDPLVLVIMLICINLVFTFFVKRIFGLKIFEGWPRYENKWKNTLSVFMPIILGPFLWLISYLIYLAYS